MTSEEFINAIEQYYGKYENPYQKNVVLEYIRAEIVDEELPRLYRLTLEGASSQYGKVPDIAVLKKIITKYNDEHGEWYRFENGHVAWLGEGIGIAKPVKELIDSPGVKGIEEETGHDTA